MLKNRDRARRLTLAHEGGYSNHPKDPGGATMQGVTQRVYDAYLRNRGLPARSVREISVEEIAAIYDAQYWHAIRGDDLPPGLDYAVFDFAVNSGVSRAAKALQTLVGFTGRDVDGLIGERTLSAVRLDGSDIHELSDLICDYCYGRLGFVRSLSTFGTFGKGWTRRIIGDHDGVQAGDHGVIDYAIAMTRVDYTLPKPSPTAIGVKDGEVRGQAVGQVSLVRSIGALLGRAFVLPASPYHQGI